MCRRRLWEPGSTEAAPIRMCCRLIPTSEDVADDLSLDQVKMTGVAAPGLPTDTPDRSVAGVGREMLKREALKLTRR